MPLHRTCILSPTPFPPLEHSCEPTSDHIFSLQNIKPRCAFYINSIGMFHVHVLDAVPTCMLFICIAVVMGIVYFLFPCMGNSLLNCKHSIIGTCVFASLLLRMQLSVFSVDIADVKFVVKLHRWPNTDFLHRQQHLNS